VQNFLSLPDQNDMLTAQIAKLEQELQKRDAIIASLGPDSLMLQPFDDQELKFRYHPTHVVSMTTNRRRNHVVLDKGAEDGITEGMGVITPDRKLVGSIVACSENYSVVMPLLNTRYKIGGRLIDNDYVCSIYWSGESRYEMTAIELSKYAEPKKGMVVNVESDRMPMDIMIGTIESYQLNATKSAYSATISIAADMSRLDNLLIVENRHLVELNNLLKSQEEE
jgi:rod shape-determining protein MreC